MAFFRGEISSERTRFADGPPAPIKRILAGRVVTMDAKNSVLPSGYVCIDGNTIAAVVEDIAKAPAEFARLTPVQTQGTIYPGLIELHNHLPYNFLPLWNVPQRYRNRNVWRNDFVHYLPEISWPSTILGKNPDVEYQKAIVRYVECRSLFGGVTTAQGMSGNGDYYKGLTRNVEQPLETGWPKSSGQTLDYRPEDVAAKLLPALQQPRPFFYHLSEGTDEDARQRFLDLDCGEKGWAINENLIAIHCTALRSEHLQRMTDAAGMVWSPLSNMLLYGQTADVEAAKKLGVRISLGSDWGPSGSKNLLGELKFARIVSDHLGGLYTNEELVRMVTTVPAKMLRWDAYVGSIEAGKRADLLVLADNVQHPYSQLIDASENQVICVMVDGRPRLGRQGLLDFAPEQQETVRIGGWRYILDLAEDAGQTLGGMSLATASAKLAYGLWHLPELARDFPKQTSFMIERAPDRGFVEQSNWGLELEFEPELRTLAAVMEKSVEIDPTLMKRSVLPPLTETDDPDFRARIRANINLPAQFRECV
ncbi:MAG TPA: amidohydrolase family protein [Pseudolabrys sp.]|nr:amidohydrolase family protein [Pseudolabrys sp.]